MAGSEIMRIFARRFGPLYANRLMNDMEYTPQPVDTSGIRLPEELDALSETLARQVHEVWAKGRKEQGWTSGKVRSDERKTHPCLVPYEELPEEEKDYDRRTSRETLRMILKSGFRIVPPSSGEEA